MMECCFTSTETVVFLGTVGLDIHLSSVRDIGFVWFSNNVGEKIKVRF